MGTKAIAPTRITLVMILVRNGSSFPSAVVPCDMDPAEVGSPSRPSTSALALIFSSFGTSGPAANSLIVRLFHAPSSTFKSANIPNASGPAMVLSRSASVGPCGALILFNDSGSSPSGSAELANLAARSAGGDHQASTSVAQGVDGRAPWRIRADIRRKSGRCTARGTKMVGRGAQLCWERR